MSRTLSRPIGSMGLGSASRAVPRFAAAPLRIQGGPRASSTSIFRHAPSGGRASVARPAVDRDGRSPSSDETTDGLEDPSAGPAAEGISKFPVRIPPDTLKSGALSLGKFLRFLRLDWKLANGCFVETGCPYFTFTNGMKTAEVKIPVFAFIGGRWRPVEAKIVGRTGTEACNGKTNAAFRMRGLRKAVKAMGVREHESVQLVVKRDEDGRILWVGLMRVDPGAQGLETAAGPQPAAPEQAHEEAEEASKAAGAASATADPSAASGAAEPSTEASGSSCSITVGDVVIKNSIVIMGGNGNPTIDSSTNYLLVMMNWLLLAALAAAPRPAGGKKQGTRQKRQKAKKAAEPAAAPEPEPTATAKAEATETAVSSKTPRSGDNYITNNITNNIGYLNQANDLRENHLGVDEWRSGGW